MNAGEYACGLMWVIDKTDHNLGVAFSPERAYILPMLARDDSCSPPTPTTRDELGSRGFFYARAPMTPLQIEYRPVASLIPHARNAKRHSDAQVAQIAASIREFGWGAPVIVDGKNNIVAGHGRVLAARKLGMAEVPVVPMAHLTDIQRRALILADNKIGVGHANVAKACVCSSLPCAAMRVRMEASGANSTKRCSDGMLRYSFIIVFLHLSHAP